MVESQKLMNGKNIGELAADTTQIQQNLSRVHERIVEACRRSGRRADEITLLGVSKGVRPERIRLAYNAGLRHFGENRVQEADSKRSSLADLTATWHFIGHLQTNKAKTARELFHWVHSIDSFRIAEKLDQAAVCDGERLPVLIEVKLGEETAKSGVQESEVLPLVEQIRLPVHQV